MLTKAEILASNDVLSSMESVQVPEWKGPVNLRVMTGLERGRFEIANGAAPKETIRGRLLVSTICDVQGNLLFEPIDAQAVGNLSSVALDRVFEVSLRINGIGPDSVEDEAKNSSAIPSSSSLSSLPTAGESPSASSSPELILAN
jgi:hypothetical protein